MSPNIAAIVPHAVSINTTRVCLKSAEPFYEPGVLTNGAPVGGRALRYAGAPRPPPSDPKRR